MLRTVLGGARIRHGTTSHACFVSRPIVRRSFTCHDPSPLGGGESLCPPMEKDGGWHCIGSLSSWKIRPHAVSPHHPVGQKRNHGFRLGPCKRRRDDRRILHADQRVPPVEGRRHTPVCDHTGAKKQTMEQTSYADQSVGQFCQRLRSGHRMPNVWTSPQTHMQRKPSAQIELPKSFSQVIILHTKMKVPSGLVPQ